MRTLFNVKFNWGFYILVLVFIRLAWIDLSMLSFIALAIALHQFMLLFYSVGAVIPIRYLAGSLMCLQLLVGPSLAYNGLDDFQTNPVYKMAVPEAQYFSYVIPAVLLFILGLHIRAGRLRGEIINEKDIRRFVDNSGNLPYILVGVGFLATYFGGYFGAELAFVFYLISNMKFIGAFMLILGTRRIKVWVVVLVFGSILLSSLKAAMFHDLLIWLIFLAAVLCIRFKPSVQVKLMGVTGFLVLAIVIQVVKGAYRQVAWNQGAGDLESFQQAVDEKSENNSLFSTKSLGQSNVRINQGFIITHIMAYTPEATPYANGEELGQVLEAAFLPRVIAPNKLRAGDRTVFTKYSGIPLLPGTSMALSPAGDAYANFGIMGGCIFLFILGFVFSEVLNAFDKFSKIYPFLLLFPPLVFYYPIRADCELQTSLGHLVKSCFLVYMMIIFWKKDLSKVMSKKSLSAKKGAVPATA